MGSLTGAIKKLEPTFNPTTEEEIMPNDIDVANMDALIEELKTRIADMPVKPKVSLTMPASLTVKEGEGKYKKRSHIGGEEFTLLGVYKGSKKGLIYMFKPVAAESYAIMEMPEADALSKLSNFRDIHRTLYAGGLGKKRDEALKAAAREKELEQSINKFSQYADFGSF